MEAWRSLGLGRDAPIDSIGRVARILREMEKLRVCIILQSTLLDLGLGDIRGGRDLGRDVRRDRHALRGGLTPNRGCEGTWPHAIIGQQVRTGRTAN